MNVPHCPYCGEEVTDSWEDLIILHAFDDGDGQEWECGGCGRAVRLVKQLRVEFVATKVED